MAKRLDTTKPMEGGPDEAVIGATMRTCSVCGGPVVVEDLHRDERFPRRLRCLVCDAEYGTTRPPSRNY